MSTFTIGDEVTLPQGHRAILRWIGRIPGKALTEFAGVEILGPDAQRIGKHSGAYQDKQFFRTSKPNTGLFVSYTQLVSANVKPPRFAPDTPGYTYSESTFGSPCRSPAVSPRRDSSPRLHLAQLQHAVPQSTASSQSPQNASQRVFFRESLKVNMEKCAELAAAFELKLSQIRADYDLQIKKMRRSSTLNPIGSEFEEQRLALAAMQNKLINERSEKQDEIDRLKNELNHMRKLTGSVEDLEALVIELENSEKQLAQLRSQVKDVDELKRNLADALQRNAELELATKTHWNNVPNVNQNGDFDEKRSEETTGSTSEKVNGAAHSTPNENMVTKAEYEKLEKLLEAKILKESELEAENEQLQLKLSAVEKQLQQADKLNEKKQEEFRKPKEINEIKTKEDAKTKESDSGRRSNTNGDTLLATTPNAEKDISSFSPVRSVPIPETINSNFDVSIDLTAGRSDWCSLCERQGHSTVECPY